MIIFTKYLHEAIRNGLECDCYPIPSLSKERDGEHHAGCRWAAYVAEIYKLERREEKIMAAHARSAKKFHNALNALGGCSHTRNKMSASLDERPSGV